MDRRKFIQLAGRSLMMAGLIAGSGYILLKKKEEGNCNFDFVCKECRQLKSCSLDQAEAYKKSLSKTKND